MRSVSDNCDEWDDSVLPCVIGNVSLIITTPLIVLSIKVAIACKVGIVNVKFSLGLIFAGNQYPRKSYTHENLAYLNLPRESCGQENFYVYCRSPARHRFSMLRVPLQVFVGWLGWQLCELDSDSPVIPGLILILWITDYSQNYSGIIGAPLIEESLESPVATHFRSDGHSESDLSVCVIDRLWMEDTIRRTNQESRWIRTLGTPVPNGMNLRSDAFWPSCDHAQSR